MRLFDEIIKKNIIIDFDISLLRNKIVKINNKLKNLIIIIYILIIFYFERKIFLVQQNINKYNPKISIFLPIYNKEKYIKRSISSIQRQTLKELEIIAINDGSTDNSLKILNDLAKKDPKIKIINNKKNRGLLYSRAMGILNSRGEYLINLDPDDKFHGSNDLRYLYNVVKKYNADVVNFVILYIPERIKYGQNKLIYEIVNQPLFYNSAFKDDLLIDYFITNKLIKKELFQNAFQIFKSRIYKNKWNYHEDNVWSILIHKYANYSINVNKIIYYYYKNRDSEMENKGNELEMINLLYRYDMYKKIFKSKKEKKYFIAGYNELLYKFEENFNVIKESKKIKKQFFKISKEYIKKYNPTKDNIKKIKIFFKKIT